MDVTFNNWYKNWFGNEYLTVYAHRDEDEAKELIGLIHSHINLKKDSLIMDLCCGQGRHALALAALGYKVVGVDLSKTLLESAKFRGSGVGNPSFIQADMRYLPFEGSFDLLLNLFTSFGYFKRDSENHKVFYQFKHVLKKNARFVFDYLNPPHVYANLVASEEEQIGNLLVRQERSIEKSRVQKIIRLIKEGHTSVFYESVKLYQPEHIYSMLESAGLKILEVLGDYKGASFSECSPRLIIIGSS